MHMMKGARHVLVGTYVLEVHLIMFIFSLIKAFYMQLKYMTESYNRFVFSIFFFFAEGLVVMIMIQVLLC